MDATLGLLLASGVLVVLGITAWILVMLYLKYAVYLAARRGGTMPILGGLACVVVWEASEALLVLKYKKPYEVIQGEGRHRLIYTCFGEEVAYRESLTHRRLSCRNDHVLSSEGIPLAIELAVHWRITDLLYYYYKLEDGDEKGSKRQKAEGLINDILQSTLRDIIAQESFTIAVTSKLPLQLRTVLQLPAQSSESISEERVSQRLQEGVREKLAKFGIEVSELEILACDPPKEITDAIREFHNSTLYPLLAEQRAAAKKIELQGEMAVFEEAFGTPAAYVLLKAFEGVTTIVGTSSLETLIEAISKQIKPKQSQREPNEPD